MSNLPDNNQKRIIEEILIERQKQDKNYLLLLSPIKILHHIYLCLIGLVNNYGTGDKETFRSLLIYLCSLSFALLEQPEYDKELEKKFITPTKPCKEFREQQQKALDKALDEGLSNKKQRGLPIQTNESALNWYLSS